ncbi:MAG TPA: tryptophan 2,3-dioxygenase family protein [Saprospiraceae bacterium]|nr:tryptophan 2,3-dioxygenase family protein [Saprospiraceae bacterium]
MSTSEKKNTAVHYHTYLELDKILNAQHPKSVEEGTPAHDETLFIILHQVYELWFKQIIHELDSVMAMFEDDLIDEREISTVIHRLGRIIEIQHLLIAQIRVMETMTPLDFLDFRNYLFPASGFQSFQFRVVETMMGLRREQRVTYNNQQFDSEFDETNRSLLKKAELRRSLLQLVNEWLERTPFLDIGDFHFAPAYSRAVQNMLANEKETIETSELLSPEMKAMRIKMVEDTYAYFASVLDQKRYAELLAQGVVKLSHRATVAALLINLYRDEPILQMPFRLLAHVMDIEEAFTSWRYRHAQMVLRMIGRKTGTGGSSGHDYLNETAKKHHIFSDLMNISTLLIPRSELPKLPDDLRLKLGFHFTALQS